MAKGSSGKNRKKSRRQRKRAQAVRKMILQLTPRQREYRNNRLKGMSIFAAARAAGYGATYARTTATRYVERIVKPTIIEELDMAGATNSRQAKELTRIAFEAMETENCEVYSADEDGNIKVESAKTLRSADTVRLKALEQIGRLKKQISAPFEKSLLGSDFTRLTIIVEKEPEPLPSHERSSSNPDIETVARVALSD